MNDPTLLDSINETKAEINRMLHHEELTWRQRSRAIWLPAGDKNTVFPSEGESKKTQKSDFGVV